MFVFLDVSRVGEWFVAEGVFCVFLRYSRRVSLDVGGEKFRAKVVLSDSRLGVRIRDYRSRDGECFGKLRGKLECGRGWWDR